MPGVKDKINSLHGIALIKWLQGWKNWILSECKRRGITPDQLGYSKWDLDTVAQILLDYCDNLSESECKGAIIEAIKEHGGILTPEEERLKYAEVTPSQLPSDIRKEVDEVIESIREAGKSDKVIYEVIRDILEDYEIPNAEVLASELVGYTPKPPPKTAYTARKHVVRTRRKTHRTKKPYVLVLDALSKYVLVSKPTNWAKSVSGEVTIGNVGGHKIYLIVKSRNDIEEVIQVSEDQAIVKVSKGWLEVY